MAKYIIEDAPEQSAPSNKYVIEDAPPPRPVGVGEDVGKSLAIGVPKGFAGLVGLPGTIMQGGTANKKRVDAEMAAEAKANPNSYAAVHTTMREQPSIQNLLSYLVDKASEYVPSGKDIQKFVEKGTGEWYKPKTMPGRVAEFTGEMAAGMGKPNLKKAGQALTSGLAGGTMGEVANSVSDNPILKAFAQMAGVLVGGAPWAMRKTPASVANDIVDGATPSQLQQAQSLMDDAARAGTPITGPEAIAHVMGSNRGQAVQRVVEGSQEGSKVIQPMMNARPLNNQVAFNQAADQITTLPTRQASTPVSMAKQSQGVIDEARSIRSQSVAPEYSTLIKTDVPSAVVYVQRAIQEALKGVDEGSQSASMLKSMGMRLNSARNAAQVDNIYKEFRDKLRALPIDKNALTTTEKGVITPVNERLGEVLEQNVPAIAQGRAKYKQVTNDLVDPIKNSPIGDLAKTAGQENAQNQMTAQMNILMNPAPKAIGVPEIKGTIKALKLQDAKTLADTGKAAQTAKDWTRQALESHFNEIAAMKQGGAASFAERIAGNPAQRQNLEALIVESVGGKEGRQVWAGFNRMLQVFEAQGKRLASGSPTFENSQLAKNLGGGLEGAPGVMKRLGGLGAQALDKWIYGGNTKEMAKLFTDPKSINKMIELAKTSPSSRKAQLIVSEIIAADNAGDQPNQSSLEYSE